MADDDTKDEEIDIFEIDDFTAASEWERFIYRIEEIIGPHGWKLNNSEKKLNYAQHINKPSKTEGYNFSITNLASLPSQPCSIDNREQTDWKIQSECLNFANFSFTLSHHKLKQSETALSNDSGFDGLPQALVDSFDIGYDFPPRAHCLSRWYGVKEFLVLSPSNKEESIDSESRTNLLWSSVGIAVLNLKCHLPVFIQIGNRRRLLHYGMCIGGGFRTSYEMVHLQYTPHECNHVQGMIETFKAKFGCPVSSAVNVSIRFTYIIHNWPDELCFPHSSTSKPENIDIIISSLEELPFGPLTDPIKDIQLAASWPSVSSDLLNDDSNFSDLDPDHAPQWWLKVRCTDVSYVLLHEHLKILLHLSIQLSDSTAQIIRSLSSDLSDDIDGLSSNVSHVLDRLSEPVPSLSSPIQTVAFNAARKVAKTHLSESPIPESLLNVTLEYLFPDAKMTKEEALVIQTKLDNEQKTLECESIRNRDKYRNLKSAPLNSLTYNLAVSICIMNYEYGGVQGVALLWHEFVLEMRYRFENNILIPRLAQTIPNLNYCLVHQKLQMLNYCIQRRQQQDAEHQPKDNLLNSNTESSGCYKSSVSYKDFEKEIKLETANSSDNNLPTVSSMNRDKTWSELLANIEKEAGSDRFNTESVSYSDEFMNYSGMKSSSSEESEDEFFEAQEEIITTVTQDKSLLIGVTRDQPETLLSPEGILETTEMKLLRFNQPLCIPITQQPPPLTEDVLLEQQEVMTQLGTSEEAKKVRVQMQSASLMSDMEAFKAANPGCILEDFVRWYSPNDWLLGPETEEERSELRNYIREHKSDPSKESKGGWEFELDDDEVDDHLIDALTGSEFSSEGHLSLRMRVPGNAWAEIWANARPLPIRRQKRLFDDTKEGEKVLHFLSNLNPSEIALHLFPVIIHSCIMRIYKEEDSSKIASLLEHIIQESCRLQSPSLEDIKLMESISKDILKAETILARIQSLRLKFYQDMNLALEKGDEEIERFIHNLLNCSEVFMKGGSKSQFGKIIKTLLIAEEIQQPSKTPESIKTAKFPQATGREYILRTMLPRPNSNSRHCPQRLFTVITPEEFRMAGSFTQDTNFI